jgi:hypothetical protein
MLAHRFRGARGALIGCAPVTVMPNSPRSRAARRSLWAALVGALLALACGVDPASPGGSALARALAERRSDVWVEGRGEVVRLLPDDRHGNPHQRFLLRVPEGATLLVAHNLELAPRLPLQPGDELEFRGEYEWNEKGGVLHWTHDDPRGRHEGGWLRLRGELYR